MGDIKSLLLVGCGNMGHALLSRWLESGVVEARAVTVIEPSDVLRQRAAELGVSTFDQPGCIDEDPQLVVLAVKPQSLAHVLPHYRRFGRSHFVSIAAGVRLATLRSELKDARIWRVMPNMAASIGEGVSIICSDNPGSDPARAVERLFNAVGSIHNLADESLMDAATAVAGSGPAYVFYFLECLRDAAIGLGLDRGTSSQIAKQTLLGAAKLSAGEQTLPEELRRQVTSPGGTTAAGLEVLSNAEIGLASLLRRTVIAAMERSADLAP